jgi:hypothetical protein
MALRPPQAVRTCGRTACPDQLAIRNWNKTAWCSSSKKLRSAFQMPTRAHPIAHIYARQSTKRGAHKKYCGNFKLSCKQGIMEFSKVIVKLIE